MPGNKKDKKAKKDVASKATIADNRKDHSKDPFVVKKVETSRKRIEKYGFPKFD
jgi:DICT domain-containing protein